MRNYLSTYSLRHNECDRTLKHKGKISKSHMTLKVLSFNTLVYNPLCRSQTSLKLLNSQKLLKRGRYIGHEEKYILLGPSWDGPRSPV